MSAPDSFGPWVADLDPAERLARMRSLRALVQVFCGPKHPLVEALARAEVDPGDHAALEAWEVLERMPARSRRHVLASLAELMKQTPKRERKAG
jgi:hypothetical protein